MLLSAFKAMREVNESKAFSPPWVIALETRTLAAKPAFGDEWFRARGN